MPHRQPLLDLLSTYSPASPLEAGEVHIFWDFVGKHTDCFERSNPVAHVTASSWIVSSAIDQVLLNHHRKLDKWMQFGGHADGNPDVLAVAKQENEEETGLKSLQLLQAEPFDVGMRYVPEYNKIPAHVHFDVCFLFKADPAEPFQMSERESHEIRWVPLTEVQNYIRADDYSCLRMFEKTRIVAKLAAA